MDFLEGMEQLGFTRSGCDRGFWKNKSEEIVFCVNKITRRV